MSSIVSELFTTRGLAGPNRIRRSLIACVLTAGLLGTAPRLAAAADPIDVGVIVPLSGGAGQQGQEMAQAIQAMADIINAKGGVLGRPLQILVRDDESTPAVGVAKANDLISKKVAVIIEGWNSPVTLAMQPVIARAGILDVTAMAKADAILASASNPLAIRMNSSSGLDAAATAQYLAKVKPAKRIAFATENDAFGNGAQKGVEEKLKQLGWSYETATTQLFPFAQTDFRVALTSIKDSRPDAVLLFNANEGAGLPAFIRQYRQMQVPAQLVVSVGSVSPGVLEETGPAADGMASADIYFPDVEPFKSNAEHQAYLAALQKRSKFPPNKYMALSAISLEIWAITANAEKTLDREKIARAIRGHTIAGTIFGTVSFDAQGQLQPRYFDFTVDGGRAVVTP